MTIRAPEATVRIADVTLRFDCGYWATDRMLEAAPARSGDLEPNQRFPRWFGPLHIVQHGAPRRADAATPRTSRGASPGELEFLDFAESRRGNRDRTQT